MDVNLPKVKCEFCNYEWIPRKSKVDRCIRCNKCFKCGHHIQSKSHRLKCKNQ